ncbi:MAG: 1-deoxy-D-xylulose-5-phosphate synthase [Bacteroidota bacterium]|nr:1-deoxy-D-xylulose-5-phosphate synthase [Bacteroidota bacterium]
MDIIQGKLLSQINNPTDLKKLHEDDLIQLCDELRQYIIDVVSENPGHFGASLGVVELTVALHYIYNSPYDKIIWDVGHQAYAHKILTGRKDEFITNRKYKGISGFPRMEESEHDAFGVGHSSTSISAALGIAVASRYKHEYDRHQIAIIGDGSLTGGMAFEALNHAGADGSNLLVILNDNGISIDPNVGAFQEYLLDITTSKTYNKLKDDIWKGLGKIKRYGSHARALVQKIENAIKSTVLKQSNYFESLNFRYFGPVDGHDVVRLTKILNDLKYIQGPKLLHCVTVKGKGFIEAEKHQTKFHAPGLFDKNTGKIIVKSSGEKQPPKYQDVFGHTIMELAETNKKIIGITPAMGSGCSLDIMMNLMPERAFDVGIAEQHAVTFSAGLASQGLVPFCNIYSTFIQRAYDQIIHDVALQKLKVVFCLDRAGLVGEDGATHHGVFDIAFMRCIPGMIVSAPMNEEELRNLMYTAQLENRGPFSIRYPRGKGVMVDWEKPFSEIPIGKGRKLKEGKDIAIISAGHPGNFAAEAIIELEKENISVAHYDIRFIKPIDEDLLNEVFTNYNKVITIEDGIITGGMGSAVIEFMIFNNYNAKVVRLGIPDSFIQHGSLPELYAECGFDKNGIIKAVKSLI